jgi:integrase
MSKMTRDPLRMYLEHRDALVKKCGMDPQNLMIREHCGRLYPLSPNAVAARDKILGAKAGIDLQSHDLRASFGHRHWKAGTDLLTIAMLMGHESPDTTFRSYIGVSQADMRAAQDRLDGEGKTCP